MRVRERERKYATDANLNPKLFDAKQEKGHTSSRVGHSGDSSRGFEA